MRRMVLVSIWNGLGAESGCGRGILESQHSTRIGKENSNVHIIII